MARPRKDRLADALRQLDAELSHASPEAALAALTRALQSGQGALVAHAASHPRAREQPSLEGPLARGYESLFEDGARTDPGCRGKLAALEALDALEGVGREPFVRALEHTQREPVWGKTVDTAGPLRARGAAGLARRGHPEFLLHMARLLRDEDPTARRAAAEAIAHRGDEAGAALLECKLGFPEQDAFVEFLCMRGLYSLAPAWGLRSLEGYLADPVRPDRAELAALVLGQSPRPEALAPLLRALAQAVVPSERAPLLRALGQHRGEGALEALLQTLEKGREADAREAAWSLSVWCFREGVPERARAAVARNLAGRAAQEALEAMLRGEPEPRR